MTGVLLIAVVALGGGVAMLFRRLAALEAQVRDLRLDRTLRDLPAEVVRAPMPAAADPRRVRLPEAPEPAPPPVVKPAAPPPAPPRRVRFETIVGGNLPIWIGGAALVLSGFFLVRYSVESGLLGPAARTWLAGLFGLLLVAASEAVRRVPATRDDPRIAQVLAGAGTASLYGTLYVGTALYHLIGVGSALAAMVVVTLAALGLALRHGAPTAIMALIGGFAAPLLAGFGASGVGPLLVYLALLIAALFGLAIRRGWAWLALAACGGGFAWANLLIVMLPGGALAGVGGFVLVLAVGATLALPGTGHATAWPWVRLLPLVAGFVQLLVLAPALDFSALSWGLYLLLSAAALWLGWRDAKLAPGAGVALALVLMLLGAALLQPVHPAALWAAIAATAIFAGAGHLLLCRGPLWQGIAVGGTAGPALVVVALDPALLVPAGWTALLLALAIASATISWRMRDTAGATRRFAPGLVGGAGVAALLVGVATVEALPDPWRWPVWLATGVALAAWSRKAGDAALDRLALAPLAATALAMATNLGVTHGYLLSIVTESPAPSLADLFAIGLLPAALTVATGRLLTDPARRRLLGWVGFVMALSLVPAVLPARWHAAGLGFAAAMVIAARVPLRGAGPVAALAALVFAWQPVAAMLTLAARSVLGDRLPWLALPPLATILLGLSLPAGLIAAALAWRPLEAIVWRRRAIAVLAAIGVVTLYALAKQPLAIGDPARFTALGMAERVAITHGLLAGGWLIATRHPGIARALTMLGLARFVWFDLLILDPLFVPQSVGAVPLLNLATLDSALVAAWLWRWRHHRFGLGALLAAVMIAVGATVRETTHGAILTGGIDRTENWLYSAAFLALAMAWLGTGLRVRAAELRIAGLALLTAVTVKVFLIDAAALEGVLRILSFMALGFALIGIGWAYRRLTVTEASVDVANTPQV